jgi:hypothetical protein
MSTPYRLRAHRPATAASAENLLGPPVRSFYAAAARNSVWAATPFVLLLGYGVWLAHQGLLEHWFNSTFSVFAVAALFVLSAALIVYSSAVGGGELVRVHTNGILDLRVGPRAVRWDEMKSLVVAPSDDGRDALRHVLHTTDGARISLGSSIGSVADLVDEIRARMAELQLPEVRARIAEGDTVRFGAIVASEKGLSVGPRVVVWEDVAEIEAEAGQVVVCTTAGERVAVARLAEVPNAFLLAEMAHARRAKAG